MAESLHPCRCEQSQSLISQYKINKRAAALTWRFRLLSGTNTLVCEGSCGDNESGMGPSDPSHRKLSYRKCRSVRATGLCGRSMRDRQSPPCGYGKSVQHIWSANVQQMHAPMHVKTHTHTQVYTDNDARQNMQRGQSAKGNVESLLKGLCIPNTIMECFAGGGKALCPQWK